MAETTKEKKTKPIVVKAEDKNDTPSPKKPIIAVVCEWLAVVSFLVVVSKAFAENNPNALFWLVIPATFLILSAIYNSYAIGIAIAGVIAYLDIGGLPVICLIALVIIGILYVVTKDEKIVEVLKYLSGITTGTFVQKKLHKK